MDRAALAAVLEEEPSLDGWTRYAEPPEVLAGGQCIVISPRSPYQSWSSFAEGRLATHLAVALLVPRATPEPMILIDEGLGLLRSFLVGLGGIVIDGGTSVGLIEDVAGADYIVASIDITSHDG